MVTRSLLSEMLMLPIGQWLDLPSVDDLVLPGPPTVHREEGGDVPHSPDRVGRIFFSLSFLRPTRKQTKMAPFGVRLPVELDPGTLPFLEPRLNCLSTGW